MIEDNQNTPQTDVEATKTPELPNPDKEFLSVGPRVRFTPAENRHHIRSTLNVVDVMFDIAQQRYHSDPSYENRLALGAIAGYAIALPNYFCIELLGCLETDPPEKARIVIGGKAPFVQCSTNQAWECVGLEVPLSMFSALKLNVIREYVARRIMEGGDAPDAGRKPGEMEAPGFGRVWGIEAAQPL